MGSRLTLLCRFNYNAQLLECTRIIEHYKAAFYFMEGDCLWRRNIRIIKCKNQTFPIRKQTNYRRPVCQQQFLTLFSNKSVFYGIQNVYYT